MVLISGEPVVWEPDVRWGRCLVSVNYGYCLVVSDTGSNCASTWCLHTINVAQVHKLRGLSPKELQVRFRFSRAGEI